MSLSDFIWNSYFLGFFLLLLFVSKWFTSHAFRFKMKYVAFFIITMIVGFVWIPRGIVRPHVDSLFAVSKVFAWVFKPFGMKFDMRNAEYLSSDQPYIILANHQSAFDLVGMMTFFPRRCTALAKKSLKYFGPFGLSAWLIGLIFIDRLNHERAKATIDRTAKLITDRKLKVWIFPEGTRNLDYGFLPFKKGAFHLAVQAQIPLVPLVFSSYRHFLDIKHQYFNPGDVIVTALRPIPTKGLTAADVPALVEQIRGEMLEVYERSTIEVEHLAREQGNTQVLDVIAKHN